MIRRPVCLALGLSLAALAGCLVAPNYDPPAAPLGAYTYSSFDSKGDAIVRGWFTLNISPTGSVSGDWHFVALSNRKDIGPQTGDGQLTGNVVNGMLNVNLNPNWADNNVFLMAKLDKGISDGLWEWTTFVGPTSRGSFQASPLTIVE